MKFKELLLKYKKDRLIVDEIIRLYPDEKKNEQGYYKAINEMRSKRMKISGMELLIEHHKSTEEWEKDENGNDTEWENVLLREGEEVYSASFVTWSKMLGLEIAKETIAVYPPLSILAHTIWEMTFYGYSDKPIQEEFTKLKDIASEVEKKHGSKN